MAKELIIAVTKHRKFGNILAPYIITPAEGNSFYSSIEKANPVNVKEIDDFKPEYAEMVKLASEFDDSYISNLFTKKKEDARDFIQNVDEEFIQLRIRPHIEKRLHKMVAILPKTDLRLFYKDRKYAKIYRTDEIKLSDKKADAIFNFNRNAEGIQYFLTISVGDEEISLKGKKPQVLTYSPCITVIEQQMFVFDNIDSKKLQPFFGKDHISIPKQTEKTYFEKFILNSIRNFKVKATGFEIIESQPKLRPIFYLQNDMQGAAVLLMKYQYGNKIILPNNQQNTFVRLEQEDEEYRFVKTLRDKKVEQILREKLKKTGLTSKDAVHYYPKTVAEDEADRLYATINWVNNNKEELNKLGITLKQDFFDRKYLMDKININVQIIDEADWFDIRGVVYLGDFKIPFLRLRRNILKNIREYELPDGTIAILPQEWFMRYKELFLFADKGKDHLKLNKLHFNLLNEKQVGLQSDYTEKIKKLFSGKYKENSDLPEGLNAELRPYQVTGYNWMNQLKDNKFGGCLADDMGLGKTLQTLALLLNVSKEQVYAPLPQKKQEQPQLSLFDAPAEKPQAEKINPTSLIVMPASLIHNWTNEIKKFTPHLSVFDHTGSNRTKNITEFANYDIVVTTYGVIRNDYQLLKNFRFHYLILDESQVIKNPDSKIYKTITQLQAKHRLVLTGTPIENSLTDLWSQMNFVNRGLLGNFSFFKNEFVTPIERNQDQEKSEKLQSLIHPFILRRTKEQVAKDLPPRTEQIRVCDMGEKQRKIYEEEKSAVRNTILESMEKKGVEKSSMLVLQALTRLRQLANHPKLIEMKEESGKFEEVTRILENLIAEKHKVLIFSSFVQHLQLYEVYLKERGLKYSILTGKSKKREQIIEEFQNDEENRVFLISLKAGGVGLNLTAADYVFLLDPWWNPAAENQAINRAHRIGQDKKVFVYRFISSDSIEEKIVQLQERKSELADLFINSNNPFKQLSPDRIKALFD